MAFGPAANYEKSQGGRLARLVNPHRLESLCRQFKQLFKAVAHEPLALS
jgi:hypothetical protein